MNRFLNRIVRAARLDPGVYEEVEADRTALGQATLVVVASSVAAGLGGYSPGGLVSGVVAALLGWYLWAYLAYWLGTRVLAESQTRADHGELLRTMGFASAPGMVRLLGVIPGLHWIAHVAAAVWMIAAMVVAVRQALDYESTPRAAAVCLAAWVVQALILSMVYTLFGGSAA